MLATFARAILLLLVAAAPALAEVVRIDVQSRSDLVGGLPFGAAGPFEKLSGSTSVRWFVVADAAHVDCVNGSDPICSAAALAIVGTARTAAMATPKPAVLAAHRRFTNPSMLSPLDT